MVGQRKNNWLAWIYLAPALILLAIFVIYPLFNTFIVAFSLKYNQITLRGEGFGFDNFISVLTHKKFMTAIMNTALITFVSVPISIIVSLLISVALNSIKPLRNILQTIFFLPYVTNVIAIGMVFSVMFNTNFGVINALLGMIGINPIDWLGGSYMSGMFVILIYSLWSALAFKILIFTAGLQSIGQSYYDVAKVDGTPRGRVFRKITVPLLSPTIAYVAITSFIGSFKAYSSIVAIYGSSMGPAGEKDKYATIVSYIYDALANTREGAVGEASAAAVVLFAIVMVFTVINLQVSKKKVHY